MKIDKYQKISENYDIYDFKASKLFYESKISKTKSFIERFTIFINIYVLLSVSLNQFKNAYMSAIVLVVINFVFVIMSQWSIFYKNQNDKNDQEILSYIYRRINYLEKQ